MSISNLVGLTDQLSKNTIEWEEARKALGMDEVALLKAKHELKRMEAAFIVEQPIPGKNAAERDAYLFDHFIAENTDVIDAEVSLRRARALFERYDNERKTLSLLIRAEIAMATDE